MHEQRATRLRTARWASHKQRRFNNKLEMRYICQISANCIDLRHEDMHVDATVKEEKED